MVMCEMYPATWQEFIEERYFRDYKEIYTNGSEIMLVSDVKKMMQHYSQERPKGRWKYIGSSSEYKCTNCKRDITIDEFDNYCPACGADIVGYEGV